MALPTEIRSIVVFRALQLGDLVCSIPALRALRKHYPSAHIAMIGLPWMKILPSRFPDYFNEFILFPGYPGLPEQPFDASAFPFFLNQVIQKKFDLAIQLQGNGSVVNPMIELLGATHTAGYCIPNHYCPDSPFFIEYPEGISEVHRHLKLIEHLGIPGDGDHLEFPLTETDFADLASASLNVEDKKYICVHAGSRGSYRQWPPQYFASVADHCISKGWEIVLTGTSEELPVVETVASHMKSPPIIAAGKTNLGAMGALLKNAGGLISNCTGVSHIASALKVKSVVISMDGEPERWAPLDHSLHSTIDWTKNNDFNLVLQAVDEKFSSIV